MMLKYKLLCTTREFNINCSQDEISKTYLETVPVNMILTKLDYIESNHSGLCGVAIVPTSHTATPLQYMANYNGGIKLDRALFIKSLRSKYFSSFNRLDLVNICIELVHIVETLKCYDIKLMGIDAGDFIINSNKKVQAYNLEDNSVNGLLPEDFVRTRNNWSKFSLDGDVSDEAYAYDFCLLLFKVLMLGRHPFHDVIKSNIHKNMKGMKFKYLFGGEQFSIKKMDEWGMIWNDFNYYIKKMFHDVFCHNKFYPLHLITKYLTYQKDDIEKGRATNDLIPDYVDNVALDVSYSINNQDRSIGHGENDLRKGDPNICAVLELSTRAVKLLIGNRDEIREGFSFKSFYKTAQLTHTGKGLTSTNLLRVSYFKQQVLPEIIKMRTIADSKNVSKITAVATAAYRSATNVDEIRQIIKEATAIDVKIIDKADEAHMTLDAFIFSGSSMISQLKEHILLIDQGGGSTELTFFNRDDLLNTQSLDLGTTALVNILFTNSNKMALLERSLNNTDQIVCDNLATYYKALNGDIREVSCIGVGTAITKATGRKTNEQQHLNKLSQATLQEKIEFSQKILTEKFNNIAELSAYMNIDKRKRDEIENHLTLRLGLPMYLNIMKRFEIDEIIVSGTGLWYGVWYNSYIKKMGGESPEKGGLS